MTQMPLEQMSDRQDLPMDSVWIRGVFRPLMVVVLVTSLAAGFVAVAQGVSPGWGRGIVLPFMALVALESVYTTLWLASPARRDRRTSRFRIGELLFLLILTRIVAFFLKGEWPSSALLGQWLRQPLSFIDGTTFYLGFLTLLSWGESALMMGTLEQMSLKPDELITQPLSARALDWNEVRARHPSRSDLLQQFSGHWLWGGLLLALCAGFSRVELTPSSGRLIGIRHLGLAPLLQAALVIYFLGGLLLISQGRLAVLRARWQYEGTAADPAVVRRWGRLGLAMLLVIGVIAALLPFGSSFALAQILVTILNFMIQIAYLAMLLLISLLGALMALMGMGPDDVTGGAKAEPPPPPEALPPGLQLPDWLGGALIWLMMAIIVIYSLVAYLDRRGIRLRWEQLNRLWRWLRQWWALWRGRAMIAAQRVQTIIAARTSRAAPRASPLWRFLSLRRLDPRERIRYFYLSTVRRASERGVPRQPSETPREYEDDLESHWPELERELALLTEAFIEARYSARELPPEEAARVQEIWKRVKASLRKRAASSSHSDEQNN